MTEENECFWIQTISGIAGLTLIVDSTIRGCAPPIGAPSCNSPESNRGEGFGTVAAEKKKN